MAWHAVSGSHKNGWKSAIRRSVHDPRPVVDIDGKEKSKKLVNAEYACQVARIILRFRLQFELVPQLQAKGLRLNSHGPNVLRQLNNQFIYELNYQT